MKRKKLYAIIAISLVVVIILPMILDLDGDGLSTWTELTVTHTNPSKKDTDGDGLSDGEEARLGTNPLLKDTDGDGLSDGAEVLVYGTNPLVKDTDHDGVNDFQEVKLGTNPLNPDTDGDGLYDSEPFPLDSARPNLTMTITEIELERQENSVSLAINYEILADGLLLDSQVVCSQDFVQGRLDWGDFHLNVNGTERQTSRSFSQISCPLSIEPSLIQIQYNENGRQIEISRRLDVNHPNYTISDISNYWAGHSMPVEAPKGSAFDSMQQTFDEYATVVSGFILMRDHYNQLKAKFTSISNWYSWLSETFNGTTSAGAAWNNFQKYINSSGMRDLVEKLWNEVNAIVKSSPQLKTIFTEHSSLVLKALANAAIENFQSIYDLTNALDQIGSISSGSTIDQTINGVTLVLQEVYTQLCSAFFGWVKNNSLLQDEESAADGAQWYIDNLQEIRSLKGYYGVSFPQIIESNLQYKSPGERGVAWWPARYSFDILGYDTKFPFHIDTSCSTSFPLSEVHWKYTLGPEAGKEITLQVFLATESLVDNYLKIHGFTVSCIPPTDEESSNLLQARQISSFFIQSLSLNGSIYLNNVTLLQKISSLSCCFSNFQSIGASLETPEKYEGSPQNLLDELNKNAWQVTLT